ncbi:MAG TPA: signal recognition particle-docking protein FtsY [Actinomycetota bacterium]|nr:signal recognition particle-docking protein FtsY [Actinomycetota bacterium]
MLTLIIVLAAVVVVAVASTTTFVVTRRRRGELEAADVAETPPAPPPGSTAPSTTDAQPGAPPGDVATITPTDTVPPETGPRETGPPETAPPETAAPATATEAETATEPEVLERPRLRDRLGKARNLFAGYLGSVRSREKVDDTTWEELEEALILADVGIELTTSILNGLRARYKKEGLSTPDALVGALRQDLVANLEGDRQLHRQPEGTNVWLFVGVNGVGKTTTIGKVALAESSVGTSVVLAAGDTFRAAAADQLSVWGERVGAEVIRGNEGGDPGAVVFDAVQHAAARNTDLVLADTAGRLHTKVNLMEELRKVRRVASRPPGVVSEVLLVIDATTGQNGLVQAKKFAEAVEVTGVVLTKLDGTAKGGIALAIQAELGIPVKLVGVGEGVSDLIGFDPEEFVGALLGDS